MQETVPAPKPSFVPPRKRRSNDESSSTELVTHKSERSPDRAVLAGDDAPSMGDFSAACNHGTGRNPRVCAQRNSEVGPSLCLLQVKPCSLFIVAAVPSSRITLNFQNLKQGFLSKPCVGGTIPTVGTHFSVKVLPNTLVLVPWVRFPPWNRTKKGPTHVPSGSRH